MKKGLLVLALCLLLAGVVYAQEDVNVLLVVGDESNLNDGDLAVLDRLETTMGFIVDVGDDDNVDSTWADGMNLVYVSSTVSSGTVSNKFKNVPVPVIMIEPYAQDDMGMTLDVDSMRFFQAFQRDFEIVQPDHFLAAGLSDVVVVFDDLNLQSGQGVPNENGVVIANYVTEAEDDTNMIYGAIYYYEKGAVMADTTVAPERRLFAGWNDLGVAYLTEDGLKLWDATINWCLYRDQIDGVSSRVEPPQEFALLQNYPNPFNPETTISFSLNKSSPVKLTVYNLQGGVAAQLIDARLSAGQHSVRFNAQDLASGVYLYTLTTNDFSVSKKMTLLR